MNGPRRKILHNLDRNKTGISVELHTVMVKKKNRIKKKIIHFKERAYYGSLEFQ